MVPRPKKNDGLQRLDRWHLPKISLKLLFRMNMDKRICERHTGGDIRYYKCSGSKLVAYGVVHSMTSARIPFILKV